MTNPRFAKFLASYDRVELVVIGTLTLLSLLLSLFAIVSRYLTPQYALDWPGEMVVYLITWAFFLAGARAVLDSDHVKADLLTSLLSKKWTLYFAVLQDFCAMIFCLAVMVGGLQVVQFALRLGERSDSSLALPMWVYYLCLPVGLASISCRYAGRLYVSIQLIRQSLAER